MYRSKIEGAVREFIVQYPSLIEEAKISLGTMFRPTDYPSVNELESKYSFEFNILPVPTENDFRVEMMKEDVDKIKAQIAEEVRLNQRAAVDSLWGRLRELVERMTNILPDESKRIRGTLVSNIVDLTDLIPKLNIVNDSNLEMIRVEIKDRLCEYDVEVLRNSKKLRWLIGQNAIKMLQKMDSIKSANTKQNNTV